MTSLLKNRTFHNCIYILINKCKELVELNRKYVKEFPRGSLELLKDQIPTPIICACQNGRIEDVKLFINLHFYYKYIRINSIKESNMTIREMLNQKGINSLGVESTIFKSLYDNIYHKKYKKNHKMLSKNSKDIRKYILFELIDNFRSSKGEIELFKNFIEAYNKIYPDKSAIIVACELGRLNDLNLFVNIVVIRLFLKKKNIKLIKIYSEPDIRNEYKNFCKENETKLFLKKYFSDLRKNVTTNTTPLITAAVNGHIHIVEYLLKILKVDSNVKDYRKHNVLYYLNKNKLNKDSKLIKLITSYGGK